MITHTKKPSPTKRRIIDAALSLFVEQGISATTTRDIAKRAEIAEGTIYRHYESKEALAADLFLSDFLPFTNAIAAMATGDQGFFEKLEQIVGHFYRLFDSNPTLWLYIMTYQSGPRSRVPKGVATPYSVMRQMLSTAVAAGETRKVDVALYTQILLGVIQHPAEGVVYGELSPPLQDTLAEVMAAIRRLLQP